MIDPCYMCDRPSTSREHVPPRNLFPTARDIPGSDLRKDLITVPSCDAHNMGKSHDDEFLMVSLAGILGNNSIGYKLRFTKIDRAVRRTAGRILDKIYATKTAATWERVSDNAFLEIVWGTPDYERLQRCFQAIGHGLYFDTYKSRFVGDVRAMLGYVHHSEPNAASFQAFIKDKVAFELRGLPYLGANPEVFAYQFTPTDRFDLRVCAMRFYEGLDVYLAFLPEAKTLPLNLTIELMNRGVPTSISFEGKIYEFNQVEEPRGPQRDAQHGDED